MSTTTILSILFILELVIVGFGLATFLYVRLRNLKKEFADFEARQAEHANNSSNSLYDLLEQKITQTREKIAEKSPEQSEQENKTKNALLEQRIEYLKLEKDMLNESTDNSSFWSNIFSRLSAIFSALDDSDDKDRSSLRRRLSKYKNLLSKIIQEFRNYRDNATKLAETIAEHSSDGDESDAIKQSIEEFNKIDQAVRQRFETYQQELDDSNSTDESTTVARQSGNEDYSPPKASEEEIKRLHAIIGRQYDSLSELKLALLNNNSDDTVSEELNKKLEMVEKSQQELQTCIEVLEMENQRLIAELNEALQKIADSDAELLRAKNADLEEQLAESFSKLKGLEKDYNSLQQEFMRIYEKNQ